MDVSIDIMRKTIEELCKFENRIAGTKVEHAAADYLNKRFAEFGFDEVLQHKFPVISWDPQEATLKIVSPIERSIDCALFPYTTNAEKRVRLVDMASDEMQRIDKLPVYGLIEWGPVLYGAPTVAYNKALEKGLDGLIISSPAEGDMLKVLIVDSGGDLQIPVFNVTKEEGASLKKMLKDSEVILDIKAVAEKGQSESLNLEALIHGSDEDYDIVIGAHYDAWFLGAADNAAPVAVVLEVARLLKKHVDDGGTLKRTVRFLLFGAEESGSEGFYFLVNGSRVYVESQESLEKLGLVVSLDSVGYQAPNYVVTTHELSGYAKSIIRTRNQEDRFMHWAPPGYGSDHWFFTKGGVPTIYLISWPSDFYHTQKDTPEVLDYDSVHAYAEYAVNAVINFSNADVLPFDVMNQLEKISERIKEFMPIEVPTNSLQPVLEVLNNILKRTSNLKKFKGEVAKSGNRKRISRLNGFLRKTSGTINKTLGLLLPVEGESPAKHLSFLESLSEYVALNSAVAALEKLPIIRISPRTRNRFKSFDDTPMQWAEVERAIDDLRKEREKLVDRIRKEIVSTLDIMTGILKDLEALLR